ncbi:unnamed protein product [Closterium sp. NIES-65]|nr:unnamed protein product [Closterium sp. NIES-65]
MEVPPSVEITDGQRLETEQLQDESSMDGVQQTGEQQIGEQQTGKQQSGEQQIGEERIEEQQMVDQQLGEQQTGEPQTGEQEMWGIRDGGRVLVSGTTTAPVRRSTRITRGVPPLSGEQIRGLCRAVQCLAKVAHSDYITFLAAPVEVRRERLLWILWRYDVNDSCGGINTAKTAYLVVNFATDYFQTFHLSHPTCSCSALVKSVLAVFRTAPAAMRTLTITADGKEPDNIRWIIDCQNGMRKTYTMACVNEREGGAVSVHPTSSMRKTYTIACVNDREVLSASIDPSTYPSSPRSGTGTGGGAAGRGGGSEAKAVEMRSYVEPTLAGSSHSVYGCLTPRDTPTGLAIQSADGRLEAFQKQRSTRSCSSADGRLEASPEAAMHTQLWVDPGEHFEAYCHRGDAVDVTFSVKEVKAFVQFCESAAADVVMLFHRAGASPLSSPTRPSLPAAITGYCSGADPHQAYPIGSGCREDPGGGGLGEGEEEGADEMRGEEGAEKVPLKDPGAGARLEAGWAHGKRWGERHSTQAWCGFSRSGGGEGSGRGRRGSSTWPREQQQPLPGHAQQDQRQQQHDQYQQKLAANQVPDSEDATEGASHWSAGSGITRR